MSQVLREHLKKLANATFYLCVTKYNIQTVDKFTFDSLGLTQGERDAVYEAVIDLVEFRLKKAKSLNPSARRKRKEAVDKTLGIWSNLPEGFEEEGDE